MNKEKVKDAAAILNYALGSQNRLADINDLASARIRGIHFEELNEMFEELFSLAGITNPKEMAAKEVRLEALKSRFSQIRLEITKEANLLLALRETNDEYLRRLDNEICEAQDYLKNSADELISGGFDRRDLLRKRLEELRTTKTVGESFSTQIRLSEDNLNHMAERIWNVLMHVLPLLRGNISAQNSRTILAETKKMLLENARAMQEFS